MQIFIREKIFVDVILPNYNKTEFLEEAINSQFGNYPNI